MKVVWMARLEQMKQEDEEKIQLNKQQADNLPQSFQSIIAAYGLITAGEEEGKWIILWEPDGQPPEIWFKGTVWAEMRAALRLGIARLLLAGYRLSIGFVPESDIHEHKMKGRNDWIACYADLYMCSDVYEVLAKWRREVAGKLKRTPFWIATNRMLRIVSALLPHTLEELRQLPGFGDAKLNAYGKDIIAITKQFERNTTFPLDWISSAVSEEEFVKWVYSEWESKQQQELTKLATHRMLLEGLEQRLSFEQLMEKLRIDRRELIMRIEMIEREGYKVDMLAESALTSMPRKLRSAIESAFAELGDEYLKPVYIRAYGAEALEKSYAEMQANYEQLRLLRLLQRSKRGEERIRITQAS